MIPRLVAWPALILIFAATAPFVAAQRPRADGRPVLEGGVVPIGSLGHPLGSLLKIEGVEIHEGLAHGTSTLNVDTVNGKKLPRRVEIWIDGIGSLPEGKRCVIEGYENVRMIGNPPAVVEMARREGREIQLMQAGWQSKMFFTPLAIISPKELTIHRSKGGD
jgi:hypothetical protein